MKTYRRRAHKPYWGGAKLLLFTVALGAFIQWLYSEPSKPISPIAEAHDVKPTFTPMPTPSATPDPYRVDEMSVYISEAVQEFLPTHKSESLMIMHCLAHRENGHAANNHCGDSGKACGPFQFHQPTWEGYRKLMIKAGVATEIGDRYDKKESARTTAWAISTNRAYAWGPILRDSEGSNYAACQTPSWYSKGAK